MNLSQLEVLAAIVDTGSLTEAAEAVGLTQSAVSHSLGRLEAELGVTLLQRGRQGVTLTKVGEDVLPHARAILTQVDVIRQKTGRERGLTVGKLRFGIVRHVAARLLTGILRDFQHRYPDIEIVLFEGSARELVEWLALGMIDVATVVSPDGYPVSTPLAVSAVKAVLPADHAWARKTAVPLDDFQNAPLIGPKDEYSNFNEQLRRQNLTMPRLHYEVSTLNTILLMVREGMGISMMPEMLIEPDLDGVVTRPFDPPLTLRVFLAANVQSPAIEAFLNSAYSWAKANDYLPA